MTTDDDFRAEALRLANEKGGPPSHVVERAEAYRAFLKGEAAAKQMLTASEMLAQYAEASSKDRRASTPDHPESASPGTALSQCHAVLGSTSP